MTLTPDGPDLHICRQLVYLDQWVWIRMAKADRGELRERSTAAVLGAVREPSAAGVVLPLSARHYMERSKITDPQQRGASQIDGFTEVLYAGDRASERQKPELLAFRCVVRCWVLQHVTMCACTFPLNAMGTETERVVQSLRGSGAKA
jgi:hypothetical protein